MTGMEIACSDREAELRAQYAGAVSAITANTEQSLKVSLWNRGEWEAISSFDADKCQRLYRHLREKSVWVTPTLVIQRRISYPDVPEVKDNPYLKYITKSAADVAGVIDTYDPERRLRPAYDHRVDVLEDVHEAGVGILAGTDEQAGFWLHQELQIFVDAGLTELEAIQTATINPAKYLGREDELGSVEPGKFADIVLLNSNPLDDIDSTLDIHAVVLKGRIYDRVMLDRMLAQLEADARALDREDSRPSANSITMFDYVCFSTHCGHQASARFRPIADIRTLLILGQCFGLSGWFEGGGGTPPWRWSRLKASGMKSGGPGSAAFM